jgi:glycosyltransferase A (GT-A) superfamily protein (DUF2064 family)
VTTSKQAATGQQEPSRGRQHGKQRGTSYADAKVHRARLVEIGRTIEKIASRIGNAGASATAVALLERVENDVFHVMVVGDFNRGKSTFVNALLGKQVLPVKATTATAVITEVRFSDVPGALLWKDGQAGPETIDPLELISKITVDTNHPDRANPYTKAEVTWPLELCRDGVVLIDSPGLNDHKVRDEITLGYLKIADAVIFMQHAIAPMSIGESQFLSVYLDSYDPFFVFTYFDAIDEGDRAEVVAAAKTRIADLRGDARDDRRLFFVDGKAALRARIAGDVAAFDASGVAAVEHDLEHYLVTDRHKMKIISPARGLRTIARELARAIPPEIALLNTTAAELAERWKAAQAPLSALEAEAEQISLDLSNQNRAIQAKVEALLTSCISAVASEAPEIAKNAVPEERLRLIPWKVKEKAEAAAAEIAIITSRGIEQRIAQWVADSLNPVIEAELRAVADSMNTKIGSFEAGVERLRVDLTGLEVGAEGQAQEESPMTRLLSGVGGFIFGGIAGGLVGARLGPKEALRTLIPTLLIFTAWLATPWGLPTLVGALVIQALFQGKMGLGRVEAKIKEAVGKEMARQIRLKSHELAAEAAANFAQEALAPIEEAVSEGLSSRLAELSRQVESARVTRERGEADVQRRRAELTDMTGELNKAEDDLSDLIDEVILP